jgi:GH24 family phage-related lysozyme (muramidase)
MSNKTLEELFVESGGTLEEATTPDSGRSLEDIFAASEGAAPEVSDQRPNPFMQQMGLQRPDGSPVLDIKEFSQRSAEQMAKPFDIEEGFARTGSLLGSAADAGKTYASNVAQGIADRPLSTVAEVATDVTGGAKRLSPASKAVIGTLQAVPITLVKELEEVIGLTPESEQNEFLENFNNTLIEQAGAAAAGRVMKFLGNKLGFDHKKYRETDVLEDRPVDDLFGGKTATDVERKFFEGEETFTAAERTQGLVGTGELATAEKVALTQKQLDPSQSKAIERVIKMNDTVDKVLKKSFTEGTDVSTDTLRANFLGSSDAVTSSLKDLYETSLNKSTIFARQAVDDTQRVISYRNIEDAFEVENIAELETVMGGEKKANELLEFIADMRKGKTAEGTPKFESDLTPIQLTKVYRKMWNSAVGDDQREAAFLQKFMPEFRRLMGEAVGRSTDGKTDEVIRTFVDTLDKGGDLVSWRKSSTKQLFDQLEKETLNEENLIKRIVKNPKHYNDLVRNMDAYGLDAQRLIPEATRGIVSRKLAASKNFASDVRSLYSTMGKENLETVLGRESVDVLDNLAAYSELTKFAGDLSNIDKMSTGEKLGLKNGLQLIQNTMASPASPVGSFTPRTQLTGVDAFVRRNIMRNLGIKDDKALNKAMMSKIGKEFANTNLLTSDGYEVYKMFARQLGSKPVNAGVFQDIVRELEESRQKEVEGYDNAVQFFENEGSVFEATGGMEAPEAVNFNSANQESDPLGQLIGENMNPDLLPPPSGEDEIGNLIGEFALNPFTQVIAEVENSVKSGWDGETWKPHSSPEGGNDTIAYGHKLTDSELSKGTILVGGEEVAISKGLTEAQAETLLEQDIDVAREGLKEEWTNFDLLPEKYQNVLVNIAFNVGVKGASPKKWPRLFRAMMAGDDETVRKEMVTTFTTPEGNRKPLRNRAEAVADAVGLAGSRLASL